MALSLSREPCRSRPGTTRPGSLAHCCAVSWRAGLSAQSVRGAPLRVALPALRAASREQWGVRSLPSPKHASPDSSHQCTDAWRAEGEPRARDRDTSAATGARTSPVSRYLWGLAYRPVRGQRLLTGQCWTAGQRRLLYRSYFGQSPSSRTSLV